MKAWSSARIVCFSVYRGDSHWFEYRLHHCGGKEIIQKPPLCNKVFKTDDEAYDYAKSIGYTRVYGRKRKV